jgi:hypothetical protein
VTKHSSLEEQIGNWCNHFNGIQNETCRAGISYKSVRHDGKLPCLKSEGISDQCPSAIFPSAQEAAEQARVEKEAISRYIELLHSGICPTCKVKVEQERQVGRCVYAQCGHRLYQGTAKGSMSKSVPEQASFDFGEGQKSDE